MLEDGDEFIQDWCDDEGTPYQKQEGPFGSEIRVFDPSVSWDRLKWHRDEQDRTISILSGAAGWHFQQDDLLPVELKDGAELSMTRGQWHRLISVKPLAPLIIQVVKKP